MGQGELVEVGVVLSTGSSGNGLHGQLLLLDILLGLELRGFLERKSLFEGKLGVD